ncbi:AAA family ATPase [Edwardsiella ictaluri]
MSESQQQKHVFVLMGVSGSGKSAVANAVAQRLGAAFLTVSSAPTRQHQQDGRRPRAER